MAKSRNLLLVAAPLALAACNTTDLSGVYTPAQPPQIVAEEVAEAPEESEALELTTRTEGNYTLGITEQIVFPEIDIDKIPQVSGMDITFVTSANTDDEAFELLKEFGLPFKK